MSTVKLQSESSKNSEPFGTNTSSHYSGNLFLTSIRLSSTIDYRHAFVENIWLQTLYHVTETLTSESDTIETTVAWFPSNYFDTFDCFKDSSLCVCRTCRLQCGLSHRHEVLPCPSWGGNESRRIVRKGRSSPNPD